MKKKILGMIGMLLLCFTVTMPVSAAKEETGFSSQCPRVLDMAELLTEEEEAKLTDTLDEISVRQQMDVTVATTNSLAGQSVQDYADLLYEQCGFGYEETKDGLMLLISMEDNDWHISTCGAGINAFTDAGISYIGEKIVPYLSDGEFAEGFQGYGQLCDEFITQAKEGKPYDSDSLPKEPLSMIWIPISLVFGFILAFLVVGQMKAQLKTVRFQPAAKSYIKEGSMQVTERRDLFLYHTVTRVQKPKEEESSGSSVHTSFSGTKHGGGSGKF